MLRSNRRRLCVLLVLATLVVLSNAALTARGEANVQTQITILHTNDTHAHLESFQPWGDVLQGGVARRYTAIQQVKAEGGNVILVDAGDAFQGTLFFNVWQGEEEAYFMNALGYQAMAVGNHEFDAGPATLATFITMTDFPVLSANIDASAEPTLAGLIPAYTVLDVSGEQIGVFGLTTEETSFISNPGPDVVFNDSVASAQATVAELEGLGINKIVALSHCGYNADQALAAAVDGIDVIVGGHSHTLLGSMEGAAGPYPTEVTSPAGDTVLIVSAHEWGKYLGRIDVTFTGDGKVVSYSGEPIFIDESFAEDPTIAADVATFAEPIEDLRNTVIGQSAVLLEGTRALVRSQETNLGNLICDAMLWETAGENTQICITNGGGIRASIPPGDVTMGQVLEVLPFDNQIATFGLTGADVWAALENGVSRYEDQSGRFPQVGGLTYVFVPGLEVGSRIVSVEVKNATGGYDPIDPEAVYKLTSNDFMRGGGDGYDVFADNAIDPYDSGAVLADAVAEYIAINSPVSPAVEGRIVKLDEVTILHTNDEHGWLQPYMAYGSPITEGGVANLMSRFREIEGYDPDAPDSFLLLSSGDNWTGPSISTWFEGEPVVEVMNAMGYDVSVIGNHEFDFGRDVLNQRIAEADFPFLSANIYYTDTTTLADFATPYIIKEVNGVDVGLVGLTTTSTPWTTHPKNITDLTFGDYEEALRREVPNMRAEGADLIIVVGHVCSSELAPLAEAVSDLDIAVMQGGHCHDTVVEEVNGTLIIESHWAWRAYGKTELYLHPTTHEVLAYVHEVILNEYITDEGNPVTPDPEIEAIVDYWQDEADAVMGEVVGYTETGLPRRSWTQVNYVLDSWLWAYGTADFAISNWGGFRADIDAGDITVGDIVGVLPFENRIVDCAITGAQLVENLECCGGAVAGFTYTYHTVGEQTIVDSVTLPDSSPLDMDAIYHVLVNDFMYAGGDGYLFETQDPEAYDTGIQWRQPVIDWTKAQNTSVDSPIDPLIDDQPRATEIPVYMMYLPCIVNQAISP